MAWWHQAVAYQVYPRSFADSDADGYGDLPGITAHLDHLVDLGVDVLWLSPIFRSPMADNGYDVSDYYDVDPSLGGMAAFDELLSAAHARGLKVVLDMVLNHTSDEHPWFREARDPESPRRDWYIWRPAREGFEPGAVGAAPTNAGSAFGGPGWAYDPDSEEYYLHLFSVHQPDLNWENPELRAELYRMLRWWVDRGVDGFRLDVINLISKTYPPADGPAGPDGLCYELSLVANGPRLHEFLAELNREVGFDRRELFIVGETPGMNAALARQITDPAAAELAMVLPFEPVEVDQIGNKWNPVPLSLPRLKAVIADYQDTLADVGWNALYWENHDQPRSVSRFGDDSPTHRVASAKTLATTLHLLKGTPFVYQGQELGMTNAGFTSIEAYDDVETRGFAALARAQGVPEPVVVGLAAARSRDNARTPMCWDATANAGFSAATPWLRVNANHDQINVAAQRSDADSVLAHYRRLIQLRHTSPVVQQGRFALLLADDPHLFCFTRTLGDERWLVVANWSSQPVAWPSGLPSVDGAAVIVGSEVAGQRALGPWESRVYRLA